MREMAADEGNAQNWLKEEEYGRQSASVDRRKTGRNGKAAVCHLFQSGKNRAKKMADYTKSIDEKSAELLQAYKDVAEIDTIWNSIIL